MTIPEAAARNTPREDVFSASSVLSSPSRRAMTLPLPYPNQKPTACTNDMNGKTTPTAAVMSVLFISPIQNVSVRLYIVPTSIPSIVGRAVRIRSGVSGSVSMRRRRSSRLSVCVSANLCSLPLSAVHGYHVAVGELRSCVAHAENCGDSVLAGNDSRVG